MTANAYSVVQTCAGWRVVWVDACRTRSEIHSTHALQSVAAATAKQANAALRVF